jgi:hypothetical protein
VGRGRVAAQQAAELHARQTGHDEVGHHGVGRIGGHPLDRLLRAFEDLDLVPLGPQAFGQQGAHRCAVVDHEYPAHEGLPRPLYGRIERGRKGRPPPRRSTGSLCSGPW